jgi:siroheme synthase
VRPDTPAALIFNATRSSETVLRGTLETLADLADLADETGQQGPAAMVVGQVVSLSYLLAATQPSSDGRPSATTGH